MESHSSSSNAPNHSPRVGPSSSPLRQYIASIPHAQPLSTLPSSSHQRSESPSRYARAVKMEASTTESLSEKATPLADISNRVDMHQPEFSEKSPAPAGFFSVIPPAQSLSYSHHNHHPSHNSSQPSPHYRAPSPLLIPVRSSFAPTSSSYTRPRGLRIANLLKPWIPLILYAITSLAVLVAIGFWKSEVFQGLDDLSHWLQTDEYYGYAVLFTLIFITCFPPVPLYSTLIILSGYTYGPWTGAIISYFAALVGALVVFVLSRSFLRSSISHWLNQTPSIKRVCRAIEKRPKLLFLIRLAPYPYNVMNCLLAASPTLTLRTYTVCTALSLFKVIIHTSIGSSIHSFAGYHLHGADGIAEETKPEEESQLNTISTVVGVALCIAILAYLSYVARRAVDEELEDDILHSADNEERLTFLSADDLEANNSAPEHQFMVESPFRPRPSLSWESAPPPILDARAF
ncbi:hypothetical protein JAAARDRAFT_28438 [Jaapia argillacea MUCL 33604]|uniref:Golgi apparatus membrane protein TVP38 n=1 Tax=Jaapia argillacea MUCL 33604 TaxID=933084 RepID=A0A067QQ76_9AGAM|nr:hypothetical protein JAAARDRAFT_28438 [Jaapia argillacea MUCL 33604]